MKKEWKIILEILVLVGGLYGLRQNNLISTEIAITIGIIITYLIFCFQNFRQELNDELNPVKNALAEIQKFLRESFDFTPLHKVAPANKYGVSESPMRLNDEGRKLLGESGFDNLYPKIKNKVFNRLDELKTRTLYDAEENATTALFELKDDILFDEIKHYAVNHPEEPLKLIFTVASWVIRDDYAKKTDIKK